MRVATLNVNGFRAAVKKGLFDWIASCNPDVLCFQEVRFGQNQYKGALSIPAGWHWVQSDAEKKGYSSVSIWSKKEPKEVKSTIGLDWADREGRAVSMVFDDLEIWSIYFPSGTSGEERQGYKDRFLSFMTEEMNTWAETGRKILVCGDVNIAHTALDIFHDKSNAKSSGFLPHERAWISERLDNGWVDVFRKHHPQEECYSWWSNRRKSTRQKNVGWRIDYHFATQALAQHSVSCEIVDRSLFLSDHSAVVADYDIHL